MQLVVPAGQDMATKVDIADAVSSMKEHTLRTLVLELLPVYVGILGILGSILGLSFAG